MEITNLTASDLARIAGEFLRKHAVWGVVPVPIEEIVDNNLQINIIPVPDLERVFGIVSFISSDLHSISVDEYIYNHNDSRYRFSLAHEIAHIILHTSIILAYDIKIIDDYKEYIKSISEIEYYKLERQANNLAGHILVPGEHLHARYHEAMQKLKSGSLKRISMYTSLPYVIANLAKQFQVSGDAIEIRLKAEKLITRDL